MIETLSEIELDLIHYIERFHASTGMAPTDAQLNARYKLTDEQLEAFKSNTLVQKSFKLRGIIYPSPGDVFTAEQMHAAEVMTNLVDRRSDEKKLRDLGITSRQWSTWILDDRFAAYVNARTEKMLENSTFEIHKGMMKGVRNGNLASAKLAYEVTGRYRSNEEQQIDVRRVLHTFIEILQAHIKDPVLMHAIAIDLSEAASAESLSTGLTNQMMSGAQNFRQRTIAGESQPQLAIPSPPPFETVNDE